MLETYEFEEVRTAVAPMGPLANQTMVAPVIVEVGWQAAAVPGSRVPRQPSLTEAMRTIDPSLFCDDEEIFGDESVRAPRRRPARFAAGVGVMTPRSWIPAATIVVAATAAVLAVSLAAATLI